MDNNELKQKVEDALWQIRPYLEADNGGVEVVECDSEDWILKLKFIGTCKSCDMQHFTFKAAIEETIKNKIPEIKEILIVN